MKPFDDLISAFIQDQQVMRYPTFDQLLDYCARSANPVGRLVLALLGYTDAPRQKLSDLTCTALQLANFWQDVTVDYEKGRIYIPQEDMERFGYTECELRNHVMNASFVRLLQFEIERTRGLFERGAALSGLISGVGAADVDLFSRGGLSLLDSIERQGYSVPRKRITVPKFREGHADGVVGRRTRDPQTPVTKGSWRFDVSGFELRRPAQGKRSAGMIRCGNPETNELTY